MKKSILLAASALTLAWAGAASAQHNDHVCLDETCDMVSLFGLEAAAQGPSVGRIEGVEAPSFGTWGFDLAGRDASVHPGDDFFRFANGAFMDALEIPADRTRYGAFDMLRELSDNRMRALVEEFAAAEGLDPASDEAKVAALYRSFMDQARVDQLDAQPIQPLFEQLRAADDRADIAAFMGRATGCCGRTLFGTFVNVEAREPVG